MVKMYCLAHHDVSCGRLCQSCEELLQYSVQKVDKCPFGAEKGACSQCKIHCYESEMRKRIQEVMRYSGPRMLKSHPILAVRHLLKKYKSKATNRKAESNNIPR